MLRAVLGVILGYLTMAVLVFVLFTAAYFAMGADGAFQPGSYDVSTLWLGVSIVLGFVAAVVGGIVCAAISRLPKPPLVLAVVVLVLGILSAIPVLTTSPGDQEIRPGDVSNMDAMMKARQPVWTAFLNPVIGVVGVLTGARLRRSQV
jgi:hypothetical protein